MAIAEMRKLNLVGLSYDKDKILNALQKTGAVEVKKHSEEENLAFIPADCEELKSYLSSAEAALEVLCGAIDNFDKENNVKSDILKDGFEVSYSAFMSSPQKKQEIDCVISKINSLVDEKNEVINNLQKCQKLIKTAEIYSTVVLPLSHFSDTAHVCVKLGTIPLTEADKLYEGLKAIALSDVTVLSQDSENILLEVVVHKKSQGEVADILSACSFVSCPFEGDKSGERIYAEALAEKANLEGKIKQNESDMYALKDEVRVLKTYCDYLSFEVEKAELSDKILGTARTFLLEGYVPAGEEDKVKAELNKTSTAIYYDFADVPEGEIPPTLMKNKPVFANFETITNMYSPPNSRELDPTIIMAFFYSVFLGFIMADIGYGLIMFLGGGALYLKTRRRPTGITKLAGVFAVGGIFTIIWGFLFNSFFGINLSFMPTLLPNAQSARWSLAGIYVPSVLVIALLVGTVQLFAGYVCRAIQCWRRGQIFDGICDGVTWAVFSVGVILAIVGFVDEFNMPILATVGGIIAGVGLVAAMLTAGRHSNILGKFTKGFGAAYGVINYLSDVLSYARLYGLMLSGAVIAGIVSEYGVQFILSGNVAFIILGVALMIVGHVFNLAMSLLGAYIHDARLQYVEFYGRFFEGEGELFTPLGSSHKYVYVLNDK